MTWVAVAVAAGAVVGGVITSQGAQSAAQTQANALQSGQSVTQNEFNTVTAQEQPFIQGGYGALNQLNYLMGIPPTNSGGYGSSGYGTYNGGGYNYNGGPGYNQNPSAGAPTGGYIQTTGQAGSGGPGANLGPVLGGGAVAGPGGATASGNATGGAAPAGNYGGVAPPAGSAVSGGYGSLNAPFTASMMQEYSPDYQFQLQQGGQGVLNGASSAQGSESGSAMKDLIGYNQNMANTAFNNAFNQYQAQQSNTYARLQGMVNSGSSAAANLGAQGTQLSGNQAQLLASQGASMAAGQMATANAMSGSIQTASMVPWLMSQDTSDRRLKKNVKRIGTTKGGQPWYRFTYLWNVDAEGVMADESPPEAVGMDPFGFMTVDYGRIS